LGSDGGVMPITDVINELTNSGIIPIEVFIWRPEDEYETFIFQGNITEYINTLKKINIKSVFIEKREVREDDFEYYFDDDEIELLINDPKIHIDDDGITNLVELSPELRKYKQYIGKIMEIRIIAIIEGKEFQIRIEEDWGSELNILFIQTQNTIEKIIEAKKEEAERRKGKRN
jgi:hypothetical protein